MATTVALLSWHIVAVAGAESASQAGIRSPVQRRTEPPSYDWPAFTNWDCIGSRDTVDWDSAYGMIVEGFQLGRESGEGPIFTLPEEMVQVLDNSVAQDLAYKECPLGLIYFETVYLYEALAGSTGHSAEDITEQAEQLAARLAEYPFFVVAAARWPTYEALNYFAPRHAPQTDAAIKSSLCVGVRGKSGVDWDALLQAARVWSAEQLEGLEPGEGMAEAGQTLKAAADQVWQDPEAGSHAQDECPFGFVFLCITQALAGGMRITGKFDPWALVLDRILVELPFFSISAALWPSFQLLAMFSSLSKGTEVATLGNFQGDIHRFGGTHPTAKRFRRYGDLRLTADELSPLGRRSDGWRHIPRLVELPAPDWFNLVEGQRIDLESEAPMREIYREALQAITALMQSSASFARRECGFSGMSPGECRSRGCDWEEPAAGIFSPSCLLPHPKRKVVGVTFVWGERWAQLVPRFAAWAARIRLAVIIVAMGEACRRACETAAAALAGAASGAGGAGVSCWDPLRHLAGAGGLAGDAERGTIVQRHAMVHLLLHLGVDALAFDFDTFWFADPRTRLEAIADAEHADVLMTRHLDADCLNMGLLYIRASSRTAEWYHEYLKWLHQHPYEREQRGANALLNFTPQKVSFQPLSLPALKTVALDDHNEFASSRGGWLGDWRKLLFFHWVNPAETRVHWGEQKIADLNALYEIALHPLTDLSRHRFSLSRAMAEAPEGEWLAQAREILDEMSVDRPPERLACW